MNKAEYQKRLCEMKKLKEEAALYIREEKEGKLLGPHNYAGNPAYNTEYVLRSQLSEKDD